MLYPDLETVRIYAQQYTHIPVYEKQSYQGQNVLDIYATFRGDYSFLLESGDPAYQNRYSIIALPCTKRLLCTDNHTYVIDQNVQRECMGNPLHILAHFLESDGPIYPEIPVFTGGAIGHFNYEVAELSESCIHFDNPSLQLPLCQFGFVKELVVVDHKMEEVYFIVNIDNEDVEVAYHIARLRIQAMLHQYGNLQPFAYQQVALETKLSSNYTKEQFIEMVNKGKAYIEQGDIFQVVLSQRLKSVYDEDPLVAYARLREHSISPYMYYLDFKEYVVAGVSPELLLQGRGNHIKTMPIAGTRKRGKDTETDSILIKELQADPKENAEHMMLVDLGRNDIGKVAKIGSVKVDHLKEVQLYSHVMHMTSEVRGILEEGKTMFDALASLLPAGTLSGAPKIRAMEIIEELESVKREVYGGAIGFLGYNHQFDTCITIRTFIFHKQKVYIQAGAGIVKDSIPEKEYEETLQKAAVLLASICSEVTI